MLSELSVCWSGLSYGCLLLFFRSCQFSAVVMSDVKAIAKLEKVRAGHKSRITVHLEDVSKDPDVIQSNIERITSHLEKIDHMDQEILDLYSFDDPKFIEESDSIILYHENVQDKIRNLKCLLATLDLGTNNVNTSSTQVPVVVKLPKVEVPIFNGDLTKFYSFWDIFNACVHSNDSLSNISKFYYLKSYLKGSALSAIDGLELTSVNYTEAINIIKDRFGRKDVVKDALISKILDLPKVATNDVGKLRAFYDHILTYSRNLATIGIDPSSYEIILLNIIRTKLPSDFFIAMEESSKTDLCIFDNFMDALKVKIELHEKYNCSSSYSKGTSSIASTSKCFVEPSSDNKLQSTVSTLSTNVSSDSKIQ